jgi:uncharacterized protein (TIGR04222 family)
MSLNPLDWTAGPFLTLYVILAGSACLACYFMRQGIGRTQAAAAELDPLQLAYLAGGPQRVADVVALGFMTAKASFGRFGAPLPADVPSEPAPALNPFRHCLSAGEPISPAFRRRAVAQAWGIRRKLEVLGLTPSEADMSKFQVKAAAILFVPLALGVAKAFVGLSRDKPIGILIVLLVGTAFLAFSLLRHQWSTPAGRTALAESRTSNSRAARAPLKEELMLAVALTGTAVLAGTAFASLHAARQSDGGGGGGDGGGGGGGCGGCGS